MGRDSGQRQVYLVGEEYHNNLYTIMGSVVGLKKIHDSVGINCLSLEISKREYQPSLDKMNNKLRASQNGLPVSQVVLSYAVNQGIYMIATDCLDYPEYPLVVEIEEEMGSIKDALQAGKPIDRQKLDKRVDELLQKYKTLSRSLTAKRDDFAATEIDDYLAQNPPARVLAHLCGAKHLPGLKERLEEKGHEVHIRRG